MTRTHLDQVVTADIANVASDVQKPERRDLQARNLSASIWP